MARKPRTTKKAPAPEPVLHCWVYYLRKVTAKRAKRQPCPQLENKMWDYSLHSAFPFAHPQGA